MAGPHLFCRWLIRWYWWYLMRVIRLWTCCLFFVSSNSHIPSTVCRFSANALTSNCISLSMISILRFGWVRFGRVCFGWVCFGWTGSGWQTGTSTTHTVCGRYALSFDNLFNFIFTHKKTRIGGLWCWRKKSACQADFVVFKLILERQ